MGWRQRLYSNMFLRNMLSDLLGRSAYSKEPGGFIPYFQYKLGSYNTDYYLYFPKEPFAIQYRNEIFNKLNGYAGHDVVSFLDFHYTRYQDKYAFLKYLQFEISDRLNMKLNKTRTQKLQTAQDWVSERQQELQSALKQEVKQDVRTIITSQEVVNPLITERMVEDLSEKLTSLVEKLREGYTTGNIRLAEQKHLVSLIQLFYLLQTLQSGTNGKVKQQLFSNFSAIDVASILRLHFTDYKDKQQNTIQKEIANITRNVDPSSERFKRLDKALQDFFFG